MKRNFKLIHILSEFMPDPKRTGFAKTNRPDDGIDAIFPFIVPVPGNTVLTRTI